MDRIFTLIGITLAILVIVFQLASLLIPFVPVLLAAAIVLIGVGVITGR